MTQKNQLVKSESSGEKLTNNLKKYKQQSLWNNEQEKWVKQLGTRLKNILICVIVLTSIR